jgi:uncharacterized membrane protein
MIFKLILFIHIVSGATGLVTGTINMASKKGDRLHVLVGKFFLYSMLSTGICSFVLAVIHPNLFLFMVGVFTVYLVGTGQRYLYLKELYLTQKPLWMDWVLFVMMLIGGVTFVSIGSYYVYTGNTFGIVYVVFGTLGLLNVKKDFANFNHKILNKNFWLKEHISRMSAGYIAAFTAFLVVNSAVFPSFIQGATLWLLPTIIFVPLIVYWSKKIKVIPIN